MSALLTASPREPVWLRRHRCIEVPDFSSYTQDWAYHRVAPEFLPRQFEYHPADPDTIVFGTLRGELVVANPTTGKVVASHHVEHVSQRDCILALAWLHKPTFKNKV